MQKHEVAAASQEQDPKGCRHLLGWRKEGQREVLALDFGPSRFLFFCFFTASLHLLHHFAAFRLG